LKLAFCFPLFTFAPSSHILQFNHVNLPSSPQQQKTNFFLHPDNSSAPATQTASRDIAISSGCPT